MSIVYSRIHNCKNDPVVKQILIFSCQKAKEFFDFEYKKRFKEINKFNVSLDINCGAIFKLHAIEKSNGKYNSIIRCGITGHLIYQDHFGFEDPEDALQMAKNELKKIFNNS